jgi:hypothetical protein
VGQWPHDAPCRTGGSSEVASIMGAACEPDRVTGRCGSAGCAGGQSIARITVMRVRKDEDREWFGDKLSRFGAPLRRDFGTPGRSETPRSGIRSPGCPDDQAALAAHGPRDDIQDAHCRPSSFRESAAEAHEACSIFTTCYVACRASTCSLPCGSTSSHDGQSPGVPCAESDTGAGPANSTLARVWSSGA